MTKSFQQLLTHKNLGSVTIDPNLKITSIDKTARELLQNVDPRSESAGLLNLFPELFGNETEIHNIISGNQASLSLKFLNRSEQSRSRYLNLFVISGDIKDHGIVIVEDVTEMALMQQDLNQKKYELMLYKSSPVFRTAFLNQGILGNSAAIEHVRESIQKVSSYPTATVLLLGESGTGKNLVARIIHYSSMSADAPLVNINCAALPSNLIESELFGYEKGAFTHATSSRAGLFEEAQGGTIFLDEIGELPLNLQAKLLSVLETKKFRRLGSNKELIVDTRIIAASNRDLASEVSENKFRKDLFYRLNVVGITLPALRDLGNDIIIIAEHFLNIFNVEFKKHVKSFTPGAKEKLLSYSWPGNVRELSNCLERAMIFAESDKLDKSDLITATSDVSYEHSASVQIPPDGVSLEDVEREYLVAALSQSRGNKSKAAKLLGLTRDTLRYRLDKYSIE